MRHLVTFVIVCAVGRSQRRWLAQREAISGRSTRSLVMQKKVAAVFGLAVLMTASVWAHHNMSAAFDLNQGFTETGTLTQLDWRNPHIYMSVDVKGEEGPVETWRFEGPSPGSFRFRSLSKSDFATSIGKTVTVEASRARDGSQSGLIRQITLADGAVVPMCPQNC